MAGMVKPPLHLRPRVLRRDRRVRPGRQAAAPRGRPVRLGRNARHVRRLPAVPARAAATSARRRGSSACTATAASPSTWSCRPSTSSRSTATSSRRKVGAFLDALGNAVHTTQVADLSGKSVAVLGYGPIGAMCAEIARISGAARIAITEVNGLAAAHARRWAKARRPLAGHGDRAVPHQGPPRQPARSDRRRRRRRARALGRRVLHQPGPGGGAPRGDAVAPRHPARPGGDHPRLHERPRLQGASPSTPSSGGGSSRRGSRCSTSSAPASTSRTW